MSKSTLRDAVEQVIEFEIRPLLKIHGGDLSVHDVTGDGSVHLEFEGACRGCALQSVTYAVGVRQRLLEVDGVTDVTMQGVRLSNAALNRVAETYDGHTFRIASVGSGRADASGGSDA